MSTSLKRSDLLTPDTDRRNEAFKQLMEDGWQMVHRLRDWSEGEIVWGWSHYTESGSTGKTFQRDPERFREAYLDKEEITREKAHEAAISGYDGFDLPSPSGARFLWAARISKVRTEPRDPADPGEPPLKEARLESVVVVESWFNE